MRYRIRQTTARYLGSAMWPHLFRDCLATHIAVTDPEHVRIATPLLGHRTGRTTEQALQSCRAAAGRFSLARGAAAATACRRAAPAREKAMQAVIYARYSSDAQREASIEDQVRLCRELAERQGWAVVEVYADHALSGASTLRPGYQRLLEDVRGRPLRGGGRRGAGPAEPRPGAHRRPVQAAGLLPACGW